MPKFFNICSESEGENKRGGRVGRVGSWRGRIRRVELGVEGVGGQEQVCYEFITQLFLSPRSPL